MAEQRSIEQVRSEIERERSLLSEEITTFREEARSLFPVALASAAVLGLLRRRRGATRLLRLLARLR